MLIAALSAYPHTTNTWHAVQRAGIVSVIVGVVLGFVSWVLAEAK